MSIFQRPMDTRKLQNFHPWKERMDQPVWELRRDFENRMPERAACACKILSKEEFDQMVDYWISQAQCFQNWLQYGISLICGAMYWNFRCGTEKEQLTQSHELWPSQMRNYLGNWRGPSGCFATDHITVLGKPVGWCYREEPSKGMPDSGWRFFFGGNGIYEGEGWEVSQGGVCTWELAIL